MLLSLTKLSLAGMLVASVSAAPTERNNDKKHGDQKHDDKKDDDNNNRSTTYSECQRPKAQGTQLQGCPEGILYVSQTDPQAEYGTVSQWHVSRFTRLTSWLSQISSAIRSL
jgi:hypothetical protein